jgi:hypothetical protein
MMVSFYDVNFHAWIIKGDSMEARFIPITGSAARSLSRVTLHESRNSLYSDHGLEPTTEQPPQGVQSG